jgi:hypothetical protein
MGSLMVKKGGPPDSEGFYLPDEELPERLAESTKRHDLLSLGRWFANSLKQYHTNSLRRHDARIALNTIVREWRRRNYELLPGADRSRPDVGVLKGIGYSVGRFGLAEDVRCFLIDYLMDGPTLPPIKDQTYIAEWGGKRTAKRYFKAHRALTYFAGEYANSDAHTRAVKNWMNDLKYLEQKWEFLSGRPRDPYL